MKEQNKNKNKTKAVKKTVKATGKDKSKLTGKERSLANLKPFKKGQSGNPKGYTKGKRNWDTEVKLAFAYINQRLREKGEIKQDEEIDVATRIITTFMTKAMNGDNKMIELFLERMHGKVTQDIAIGGNGNPIENIVIDVDTAEEVAALRSKWRKSEPKPDIVKPTAKKKVVTKKIKFK